MNIASAKALVSQSRQAQEEVALRELEPCLTIRCGRETHHHKAPGVGYVYATTYGWLLKTERFSDRSTLYRGNARSDRAPLSTSWDLLVGPALEEPHAFWCPWHGPTTRNGTEIVSAARSGKRLIV